jgi:[acyl-carrier-protein] S-malonyltransferase
LVRLRAQAMQDAVPVGSGLMVAVLGLDAAEVRRGCEQAARDSGQVVAAANFNDPKQTVIAGGRAGVEMAAELLKHMGAKRTVPLSVSAPFHCALMQPAAEKLRAALVDVPLCAPSIPVVNNIDVVAEIEPDRIRDALYRQAFGPVRWVEVMAALHTRGIRIVVECGPGKVLSRMVKRIVPDMLSGGVQDPTSLVEARTLLS